MQFETVADAEDAIRGRDGYEFDGERLRVELAHSGATRDRGDGRGGRGEGRERYGGLALGWWTLLKQVLRARAARAKNGQVNVSF